MAEPQDPPEFSNRNLKNIGLLPGINAHNDPDLAFSNYKKNLMRVIDLVPIYFTIDLYNLFSNESSFMRPVRLDFLKGIMEYNKKLEVVGLGGKFWQGVRAWVTNETSSQDEIANMYKENKMVETYNNMLDTTNKSRDWMKSAGVSTDSSYGKLNAALSASLIDGRHLSLPRIWEKSDYNPSLSLTVKLNSPYGNAESFRQNIAEPLLFITALCSPSSYDGITYGLPSYVLVRAYGVSYMTIATIDSISVTRGGGDVRVNAWKQPLEISVSISCKNALPGFASMLTEDIATINDIYRPVGDEDVNINGRSVPGITTLGSIIESLRRVEDSAGVVPNTLKLFGKRQGSTQQSGSNSSPPTSSPSIDVSTPPFIPNNRIVNNRPNTSAMLERIFSFI